MFLAEKLQRTLDEFEYVEDPQERLGLIIDRARNFPPLAAFDRVEANRVRGCVSVVWLVAEVRERRCYFRADAESPLVRGLVVFVADFFSGAPVDEIAASALDPLAELGLIRNLSPTRRNGLAAALNSIRTFAAKFR